MKTGRIYPILTVMVLLILGISPVSAQKGLQAGISAGIQNTLLRSKERSEIDVRNAFCPLVTADIQYGFSEILTLQSGIGYALYSQNTSKFRNNFGYLTVPLYLKVGGFRNSRRFALGVMGGPNFKFLLSATNVTGDEKNDIREYTTGFHLDYTVGLGLTYRVNDRLILESHLTGTFLGGSFNRISTDGFNLRNLNYGVIFGFHYLLMK